MSDDPFGPKKKYRSVSQLNQYKRCPHSYYLARIERAWQRPAAWLAQGTAVHAVLEARERSGRKMTLEEAQELFKEEYAKEANEALAITPNTDWWSASGPYRGGEDLERRFHIGLEQIEKHFVWTDSHPGEVIWITPDGAPAIELEFDIDLDGIPVRGFIDAIIEVEVSPGVWELRVRDYKTGNTPGDDFQLGVYGVAVQETYGVTPRSGDYYMAGKKGMKGRPTHPFDLSDWTKEAVSQEFRELEVNLAEERFEATPSADICMFCDVSHACQYAV